MTSQVLHAVAVGCFHHTVVNPSPSISPSYVRRFRTYIRNIQISVLLTTTIVPPTLPSVCTIAQLYINTWPLSMTTLRDIHRTCAIVKLQHWRKLPINKV